MRGRCRRPPGGRRRGASRAGPTRGRSSRCRSSPTRPIRAAVSPRAGPSRPRAPLHVCTPLHDRASRVRTRRSIVRAGRRGARRAPGSTRGTVLGKRVGEAGGVHDGRGAAALPGGFQMNDRVSFHPWSASPAGRPLARSSVFARVRAAAARAVLGGHLESSRSTRGCTRTTTTGSTTGASTSRPRRRTPTASSQAIRISTREPARGSRDKTRSNDAPLPTPRSPSGPGRGRAPRSSSGGAARSIVSGGVSAARRTSVRRTLAKGPTTPGSCRSNSPLRAERGRSRIASPRRGAAALLWRRFAGYRARVTARRRRRCPGSWRRSAAATRTGARPSCSRRTARLHPRSTRPANPG